MTFDLSPEDIDLLLEALGSHIYWQLSDTHYRNNGEVDAPGSDDEENAEEIQQAEGLAIRLQEAR